jgi:hypothetical protein
MVLPTLIVSHTQRVQTSKELTQILPSRSNKDKDAGQAADETIKKLRVRTKQSHSQQDTQVSAQISKLQKECNGLAKAMYTACKPQNPIPLKSKVNLSIQGARLLLNSAWNWTGISSSCRSRDFHIIAGAAVLEFNITAEYRDDLLESTPAAVVLRSALAAELQLHMKKPPPFFAKSKTATVPNPDNPFNFADELVPPPTAETFPITDTLPSWVSYQERGGDQLLIQKIVHAVEKCPLAWEDPQNTESKSPGLKHSVHSALKHLVRVSRYIHSGRQQVFSY